MTPSEQAMYEHLRAKLAHVVPDVELRYKAQLAVEINEWKKKRNAVILAHAYMEPVLYYSVADFTGDSLGLSRQAQKVQADVIVFCGVRFMAETAKILNPNRTVLIPSPRAGCSLAESITAEDVRRLRQQYPGVPVVSYINTYAEVKAESDVCCTSSNAAAVVRTLNAEKIIFLPDEYLARNVARETGRHIIVPTRNPDLPAATPEGIEYVLIGWHGRCEVHERFTVDDVRNARRQFPDVVVLAHPECKPEVVKECDFVGSTSDMIKFVAQSKAKRFVLLTECAMGENVATAHPDKEVIRLCSLRCPHMNEITMEETLESLRQNRYVVEVPEEIRLRALRAVERMIEIG